jgi:putative Mg2+ transporter-C (MgtC) family protein
VLAALFVLAANTLLRPIVNQINRKPIDVESVEVTNIVYVIAERPHQKTVMAQLEQALERGNYPTRALNLHPFGNDEVEIEATLASTSVDGDDLDLLVAQLQALPFVRQAFWSPSTAE